MVVVRHGPLEKGSHTPHHAWSLDVYASVGLKNFISSGWAHRKKVQLHLVVAPRNHGAFSTWPSLSGLSASNLGFSKSL